jgi:exopolysaccharide production protein ExoZ
MRRKMKMHDLNWLQALRGIAAILVVICHARVVLRGTPYEAFAERALTPGAMGVDLFFMISGFIMVYTTDGSNGSLEYTRQFWIKRFARVWPVYVIAILLDLALRTDRPRLFENNGYLWATIRSAFFLPIDAAKPPYFNQPYDVGWTLNFEMYFYLIFGISMLFGRHRWTALASWLAITLIVLPLIKSGHTGLDIRQSYGFTTAYVVLIVNPIIWEFLVGVIIGLLFLSPIKLRSGWLKCLLILSTTGFALWHAFSWQGNFNGLGEWGWPLGLMFLVIALVSKDIAFRIPKSMVWLGGVSYSVYLFHPISGSILWESANHIGQGKAVHTWAFSGLMVVFSILFAAVANALFEKRLSTLVRNGMLDAARARNAEIAK